jgi:molecular chaperone HscB
MHDYFERLGLPRRFSIDAAGLERAYLAGSRAVHPDYHAAGSDADLAVSTEASAAVNEAYTTLRDPFTRADHLLGLLGGPTAGEHKQMPPAFLAEMLEAREQVEEARGTPEAVARLEAEFSERYRALMDQVGRVFAQLDSTPESDAGRANLLGQVRGLLNAAKYARGLLRDLHAD